MEQYTLESHELDKKLYGISSSKLISGVSSLVASYFNLQEYEKGVSYGDTVLTNFQEDPEFYTVETASLFTNVGICYVRLSDFSKAILFLGKAESVYRKGSLPKDERYINLLNSLASTYFYLGQKEKSDEYFRMGYELIKSSYSILSMNFLNSYAVILGNAGETAKGEAVLKNLLKRANSIYGSDSRIYIDVLKNYAEYLRTFGIDFKKSLALYTQCTAFAEKHAEDVALHDQILLGYASALSQNNKSEDALKVVQSLIFNKTPLNTADLTVNPVLSSIEPNQWSLKLFKAKYSFLHDLTSSTKDLNYQVSAASTAELIVSLIEKLRLNISEEESRLILGDWYRDSYLSAIHEFDACYTKTGDKKYLDKAFEFSEKSKAANLLASTRELKAAQLQIPPGIAILEKSFRDDISYYTEQVSREGLKDRPDSVLISEYNNNKLDAVRKRDSLVSVLEKKYPGYYFIKYNTRVIGSNNIPQIAGRNVNYISYVMSDSVVHIFLVNRKYNKMLTVSTGPEFFNNVNTFRQLLSNPEYSGNSKADFRLYGKTGTYLYKKLIYPVRKYFISNRLLISPDNILSYIPFEAIPEDTIASGKPLYRDVPYLFRDFSISYTYSATLLAESLKQNQNMSNRLIAFAPSYSGRIDLDSLLSTRQTVKRKLYDLPNARAEAEFVARNAGGKLYLNNKATETAFKTEAGKFDIIHLAMHTAVNDRYPMYSKMIFSNISDSANDGYLNTYEVYGLSLKARMVVLSSCNTGIGQLHSGEGILSLARGFIYSGSQSVLMSMWEVEDKSGTRIIEGFYKYLEKGTGKSDALKKARIRYLENADMLGSHPYFWSSLVIYGNNGPLFHSRQTLFRNIAIMGIILLTLTIYHLRRK